MATYKMFNGRRYVAYQMTTNKKTADIICDGLRKNNFYARYTKVENGYVVYARKK